VGITFADQQVKEWQYKSNNTKATIVINTMIWL